MKANLDPNLVRTGSRLSELVTAAEFSVTQFAARVGQSAPHIYNVLSGRRPLQPIHLARYAEALGMTESDLRDHLGLAGSEPEAVSA